MEIIQPMAIIYWQSLITGFTDHGSLVTVEQAKASLEWAVSQSYPLLHWIEVFTVMPI